MRHAFRARRLIALLESVVAVSVILAGPVACAATPDPPDISSSSGSSSYVYPDSPFAALPPHAGYHRLRFAQFRNEIAGLGFTSRPRSGWDKTYLTKINYLRAYGWGTGFRYVYENEEGVADAPGRSRSNPDGGGCLVHPLTRFHSCWNQPTTWDWGGIWDSYTGPDTSDGGHGTYDKIEACAHGAAGGPGVAYVTGTATSYFLNEVPRFVLTENGFVAGLVGGCLFGMVDSGHGSHRSA